MEGSIAIFDDQQYGIFGTSPSLVPVVRKAKPLHLFVFRRYPSVGPTEDGTGISTVAVPPSQWSLSAPVILP